MTPSWPPVPQTRLPRATGGSASEEERGRLVASSATASTMTPLISCLQQGTSTGCRSMARCAARVLKARIHGLKGRVGNGRSVVRQP